MTPAGPAVYLMFTQQKPPTACVPRISNAGAGVVARKTRRLTASTAPIDGRSVLKACAIFPPVCGKVPVNMVGSEFGVFVALQATATGGTVVGTAVGAGGIAPG